jgi:MFS transporter, MHS family, proline/betaine transporter
VSARYSILLGNFLEFFEFSLYGVYALLFSEIFFSQPNESLGYLYTLSVFATGFFMRPFGAIIFGHIGDRYGRKKALLYSILGMSFATFGIGILPTAGQIGIVAPIILVILRMIQGISCGGEYTGSNVYLYENSKQHPALSGAFVSASGMLGTLCATFIGYLTTFLPEWQVYWRIPFLASLALGLIGAYIRLNLEEPQEFLKIVQQKKVYKFPGTIVFKKYITNFISTLCISGFNGILAYSLVLYFNIHLKLFSALPVVTVYQINLVSLVIYTIFCVAIGYAVDKLLLSYRKIIVILNIAVFVLALPLYHIINTNSSVLVLIAITIFSVIAGGYSALCNALMCKLFPTNTRYSGVGIGYGLGIAIFGGTLPIISHSLVQLTYNPLSPAFYLITGSIISNFGIFLSKYIKNHEQKKR